MSRRQRNLLGPLGQGGMVGLWGASSLIKSVQTGSVGLAGTAALTGTATITSVDTASSLLIFGGNTTNDATNGQIDAYQTGTIALTNATTVTVTRYSTDTNQTITAYFTVVEFRPGAVRSIQAGTIILTNAVLTNTATITSVNTAKSVCIYTSKQSNQGPSATGNNHWSYVVLTNATTVTAARANNVNLEQPGYTVVEFF